MAPDAISRTVKRFAPYEMSAESVRHLATGREEPLAMVLRTIESNRKEAGANRHLMLMGPRGIGKSFFLRLLQVTLHDRAVPVELVLLPEEQSNLTNPASLLRELRRVLIGAPPASVMPDLGKQPGEAWDQAVEDLATAIDAKTRAGKPPLMVAAVENFDRLLARAFKSKADQSRLRHWLDNEHRVMLLVTTLAGDLDQRYEDRLFHSFTHYRLQPWETGEYLDYFERRASHDRIPDASHPRAKIRAISQFTGGSPRMAVILSDLLRADGNPVDAARILDALVDDLTPYYQDLLWERMPDIPRALFDALIRGGEPCSQSELAARVGLAQNRIAQHFAWLRDNELVYGERETGGRATLYRVADRVLVQYYRTRHLHHQAVETPLAAMTEFLATFYRGDEIRDHALRLFEQEQTAEAKVFAQVNLEKIGLHLAECPAFEDDELLQLLTESLSSSHEYRDDEQLLEQQLTEFQERLDKAPEEDHELRGILSEQIGWLSMKLDRAEESLTAHRDAIRQFDLAGNQRRLAWNWMALGWYCDDSHGWFTAFDKDPEQAEEHYQRALKISVEAREQALATEVCYWLGQLHLAQERPNEAREAFQQGAELAEQPNSGKWQSGNLLGLAKLADREKRPERALELRLSALSVAMHDGAPDALASCFNALGQSYVALGQAEEAREANRRAIQYADQAKRPKSVTWHLLRFVALAQETSQDPGETIDWISKALHPESHAELTWEVLAKTLESNAYIDLVLLAHRRGIATTRQSRSLGDEEKADREVGHWANVYRILRDQERYDEAIAALQETLGFAEEQRELDPGFKGSLHGYIAGVHFLKGDEEAAWDEIQRGIALSPPDDTGLIQVLGQSIESRARIQGKPAAFSLGESIIQGLLDRPNLLPTEKALPAFFIGLFHCGSSNDLIRDLAHEYQAMSDEAGPIAQIVLSTLDFLEKERDPAVLERMEPDIATTVRALVEGIDRVRSRKGREEDQSAD